MRLVISYVIQRSYKLNFDVICSRALFFVHFKLETHCLSNKCLSKEAALVSFLFFPH